MAINTTLMLILPQATAFVNLESNQTCAIPEATPIMKASKAPHTSVIPVPKTFDLSSSKVELNSTLIVIKNQRKSD